jgi:hypothetical protein
MRRSSCASTSCERCGSVIRAGATSSRRRCGIGFLSVAVENRAPRRYGNRLSSVAAFLLVTMACANKLDGPTPAVAAISPQAVCQAQLTTSISLVGERLSPVVVGGLAQSELTLPRITLSRIGELDGTAASETPFVLPDDPKKPLESRVRWRSQTEMAFDVAQDLELPTGLFDVGVENPSGRSATLPAALLAVPPPKMSGVSPDVLCGDSDNLIEVKGDFFLRSGLALAPTLNLGSLRLSPTAMTGCRLLPGSTGLEACTTLSFSLPAKSLSNGTHEVVVQNPAPVGCSSTESVTLTIVPEPAVSLVVPDLAGAAEGAVGVEIRGTDFLTVNGTAPAVSIGALSLVPTVAGCTALTGPQEAVQTCTTLGVVVPRGAAVGALPVQVKNPKPADCTSAPGPTLWLFEAPDVTSIAPLAVCAQAGATPIAISGQGFLTVSGAMPTVKIGAQSFTPTPSGCVAVDGPAIPVQQCTTLTVTVAPQTYAQGSFPVTVTNPPPVGCTSSVARALQIVPPPTLALVAPASVCSGAASLTLSGTGFGPSAAVTLGAVAANRVTVAPDGESLVASFPPGLTPGGPRDVTVSNLDGCSATKSAAVTVIPGPQIFYADPSVVFNGIAVQATIYGTGFTGSVQAVTMTSSGGGPPLALSFTTNVTRPNQVQVVIPKNLAAGSYDVELRDGTTCGAHLSDALRVVGDAKLSLTGVTPPFGWVSGSTAVTLGADTTASPGFVAVPRVYLSPTNPGPSTVATSVGAVGFIDAQTMTALIRGGLPVGTYDLIVVNPDGTVGISTTAFAVTALAPPTIVSLAPGSLPTGTLQAFSVKGTDFRSPQITLSCVNSNGAAVASPAVTVSTSTTTTISATVTADSSVAACVVRVTNLDNETFADFSALVFTNPAQNLSTSTAGPDLLVARRSPIALGGGATSAARFLHVIGGDDIAAAAFDSIESSALSLFGAPSPFFQQRNRLKQARAHAGGARIGRFLYVAGGSAAGTALDTIERAFVLDPSQRGEVLDLLLDIHSGVAMPNGLLPGLWYYRVAPVMAASDAFNPDGEGLASDPFPVLLPNLGQTHFDVTLQWKAIPGAVKYRVYRSPAPGGALDAEEVLAEVNAPSTSYEDLGAPTISTDRPLPIGSLGTWRTLQPKLSRRREGPGVAWGLDPAGSDTAYLYVIGGREDSTSALKSYEFLPITLNGDGSQSVAGALILGTEELGAARWQLGASFATNELSSRIAPAQTFIYALSGATANGGSTVSDVDAALVQPGGQLGPWTSLSTLNRAGYASTVAGNFVYSFGGQNAGPSASVVSAEICGAATSGCGPLATRIPPKIANWNSTGNAMSTPRHLMGGTLNGAFIYVVGGVTSIAPLTVTKSTEYFLW